MPADLLKGLGAFISNELSIEIWEGEVPRYDTDGNAIRPGADPSIWPVVRLVMSAPGMVRTNTTEDPYGEVGTIVVEIYGRTKAETFPSLSNIETLLVQASKWENVSLGGPSSNPFTIYDMEVRRWYLGQEEGVRNKDGSTLWRAELELNIEVHGVISTY